MNIGDLKKTFLKINQPFEETEDGLVLRQHIFDGSLNFIETTYRFDAGGSLWGVGVNSHGCAICCELGTEVCDNDKTLFLDEESQEELIVKLKAKEV